ARHPPGTGAQEPGPRSPCRTSRHVIPRDLSSPSAAATKIVGKLVAPGRAPGQPDAQTLLPAGAGGTTVFSTVRASSACPPRATMSYRVAVRVRFDAKSRRPPVAAWPTNPNTAPQTAPMSNPPTIRPSHPGPVG